MKKPILIFFAMFSILSIKNTVHAYETGELTVMTFNTCFMPYPFCRLFGGVSSASTRTEAIKEMILNADADVVCLQEIFSPFESSKLLGLLKEIYPYSYGTFKNGYLCFSNGMVVLSKYPCSNIFYHPFDCKGIDTSIERGYISFIVKDGGQTVAHITTTHLQAHFDESDVKARLAELEQIVDHIRRCSNEENIPHLLVGDLNVPWATEEYWNSPIPSLFVDDYTQGFDFVDPYNCTCTDYFTDNYWNSVDLEMLARGKEYGPVIEGNRYMDIVDYCLLYAEDSDNFEISTEKIETYDLAHPEKAISDHHALITRIRSRNSH